MNSTEDPFGTFFQETVLVPPTQLTDAHDVVDAFARDFEKFTDPKGFYKHFGHLRLSGSVREGLKVGTANESDFLLPVKVPSALKPCPVKETPNTYGRVNENVPRGYFYLRKEDNQLVHQPYQAHLYDADPFLVKASDGRLFLSNAKLKSSLEYFVDEFLRYGITSNDFEVQRVTNTPGVTVRLVPHKRYKGTLPNQINVDVIPMIEVLNGKGAYVAKWPKELLSYGTELFWRRSYSTEEDDLWQSAPENLKKALMIAKFIRLQHPGLQSLPSYTLKTIGMHIAHQRDNQWNFTRSESVGETLIEIFEELRKAVRTGTLEHAMCSEINLLEGYAGVRLDSVGSFLDGVLQGGSEKLFPFDTEPQDQLDKILGNASREVRKKKTHRSCLLIGLITLILLFVAVLYVTIHFTLEASQKPVKKEAKQVDSVLLLPDCNLQSHVSQRPHPISCHYFEKVANTYSHVYLNCYYVNVIAIEPHISEILIIPFRCGHPAHVLLIGEPK